MILEPVIAIFKLGEVIFSLREKIHTSSNRDTIIDHIHQAGELILWVSEDFSNSVHPNIKFEQMQYCLYTIGYQLEDCITKQELYDLHLNIEQANQVGMSYGQLESMTPADKISNVLQLERSAGIFLAVSGLLAAKSNVDNQF